MTKSLDPKPGLVTAAPVQPPLPLPPGLPESPLATWGVAAATSGALEAVSFGVLNPGAGQKIVALIGFVGPLVVTVCDAIIRHGHSRVTAASVTKP